MSARNINPRQVALGGINWGEHVGEHPLGFPRGEAYTPTAHNANKFPREDGVATAYHVTRSVDNMDSIAKTGLTQSRYPEKHGRDGVYAMGEGDPIALGYGLGRAPIYQVRAPQENHKSDPYNYHAGATRIDKDIPPQDVRLAGHVAAGIRGGDVLHSKYTAHDYIHWGSMHPDQCETCNLTEHYAATDHKPGKVRLDERDGFDNVRGKKPRSGEPERNETLTGWYDLPHTENDPAPWQLWDRDTKKYYES